MFNKLSALRLLLPFVIGIIIWQLGFQNINSKYILITLNLVIVCFILFQFQKNYFQFKNSWINGLLVTIIFIIGGWYISKLQDKIHHPLYYNNYINDSGIVKAIIQNALIKKTKSYKTVLEITSVQKNNLNFKTIGNCYAYFTQCDSMPDLNPGDELLIHTNFLQLKPNGNPGEFNYAAYSFKNGITHSCFIKPNQYVVLQKNTFSFATFFEKRKMDCLSIIDKYITNKDAQGIAEALLVGDRTNIDEDTWNAYQKTGIVHIIAISGMHLGIFYTQLASLLFMIPYLKKNKKATTIFCLIIMWFFSLMIGLPASVLRAALIFSILGIGVIFNKKTNSYNSLILSAFVLLCINPNWFTDVGCMLSYAAILGIMLFGKKIERKFYSKYKIGRNLITLLSMTISAQIFTLPICLYYFHQFPILLLLSNVVAIPLTFIILYLEIGILIFCWLPIVAKTLAVIATALIIFLNKIILFMSTIKYFSITNISITTLQFFILLLMVCFGVVAFYHQKFKSLLIAAILFCVFWSVHIFENWKALYQNKIIVHQINKKNIIQIIQSKNYFAFGLDTISNADIKNITQPAQQFYRASNNFIKNIYQDSSFIVGSFKNQSLFIISSKFMVANPKVNIDYVVITKNAKIHLLDIINQISPKHLIADGSNSLWKIEQWKKEAEELHLQLFTTSNQGAFIADL